VQQPPLQVFEDEVMFKLFVHKDRKQKKGEKETGSEEEKREKEERREEMEWRRQRKETNFCGLVAWNVRILIVFFYYSKKLLIFFIKS